MGLQWQKPGLQHTGEYLSSGHAYIVATDNTTREITLWKANDEEINFLSGMKLTYTLAM